MTHALEEQWAGIVKERRGKEKTTSGAGIDSYKVEDLGVMKRAEFYAACVRGVLDQILKCSIYNPADHTRMNSLYDKLIAYSVFVEHRLANGAVRVPYRDYKFSKGDDWKQRYQLLKTGWMVGMQSKGVAEMVAAWREEDGETPDETDEDAEEEVPDEPGAVVEAYDEFRAARKTGKAAGPEGFSFECVKRRGGASAGALDFYAHSRCGKKIRSRRMLVSFLVK
jgi:hypothetical protein